MDEEQMSHCPSPPVGKSPLWWVQKKCQSTVKSVFVCYKNTFFFFLSVTIVSYLHSAKDISTEVLRQREAKWLEMFNSWDKWMAKKHKKVCSASAVNYIWLHSFLSILIHITRNLKVLFAGVFLMYTGLIWDMSMVSFLLYWFCWSSVVV